MNTKTVAESVYSQQSAFINGKNELGDMEDDKDDQSVQDMDNDTMSVITQSVFNNAESHVSIHYGVRDRHPFVNCLWERCSEKQTKEHK